MASDILVTVGADISRFSRAMSTARRDMQTFNSNMSGLARSVTNMGGTLTRYITAPALTAATALAGITAVKGFGRLVGIDTARAKLTALGHDAEGVEKIMDSALDSVRGTAYGLDEAATAAASAVAAGIDPGKELTKYLTLTGDAAAIAGADFNEMARIFNQVQTANRAYMGDLNMLADRGIPIYQWLAEEAGVSAEEVRDMASSGEVSAEMFRNAIEKNIGGAAQVIGEQSFAAALRNIGSDIARIGANFLDAGGDAGGFFSTVKPLLTDFRGLLASVEDRASELGKRFGEAFIRMIERVKELKAWYDDLSPSVQDFVDKLAVVGSIVAVSIGPAMLILGKALSFIFTTLPGVIQGFGLVKGALVAMTGPVGLTIAAISLLVGGLIYLWNMNEMVREALVTAWEFLKETAISVWQGIVDFMTPIISELASFIMGIWDTLSTWWSENQQLIFDTAKVIWEGISVYIESVMNFLAPFLEQSWENIKLAIQVVWEAIKAVVEIAITIVLGIIKSVMQIINRDWSGAWDTVWTTIETVWESIRKFIEDVATLIWENIKERFQDVVDSVSERMEDAYDAVVEIGEGIIEYLANIDLFQIGADIINGLIRGIGSMVEAVWSKAKEIGSGIISTISSAVQTRSPSRLTTQIGEWVGQGLANGLTDTARQVTKASDMLAQAAVPDVDFSYNTPNGIHSSLTSAVRGTVDVNDSRDSALINAIGSLERRLGDLEVVMDGERVGRIVTPHVNEGNAVDANVRRYFD